MAYGVITTKYCGPTFSKGSRIQVRYCDHIKYYNWCNNLNSDENHHFAVQQFCLSKGLYGTLIEGSTKTGYTYVWLETPYGVNPDLIVIDKPSTSESMVS